MRFHVSITNIHARVHKQKIPNSAAKGELALIAKNNNNWDEVKFACLCPRLN